MDQQTRQTIKANYQKMVGEETEKTAPKLPEPTKSGLGKVFQLKQK